MRTSLLIVAAVIAAVLLAATLMVRNAGTGSPTDSPEKLFARVGCARCHAPGLQYNAALAHVRGRPAEELAAFIRNAQSVRPGTSMPNYENALTPEQALAIARWLQSPGNPIVPRE